MIWPEIDDVAEIAKRLYKSNHKIQYRNIVIQMWRFSKSLPCSCVRFSAPKKILVVHGDPTYSKGVRNFETEAWNWYSTKHCTTSVEKLENVLRVYNAVRGLAESLPDSCVHFDVEV